MSISSLNPLPSLRELNIFFGKGVICLWHRSHWPPLFSPSRAGTVPPPPSASPGVRNPRTQKWGFPWGWRHLNAHLLPARRTHQLPAQAPGWTKDPFHPSCTTAPPKMWNYWRKDRGFPNKTQCNWGTLWLVLPFWGWQCQTLLPGLN